MIEVLKFTPSAIPEASHGAFLSAIRQAAIDYVRDALPDGLSAGLLDVVAETEGGVIKVRVVNLAAEGPPGGREGSLFNDRTPAEFYNETSEDEFMARVTRSVEKITPRLYDMFLEAEKAFRP